MHTSDTPIGFWSAVSMGVGAMVGAGIFALLGEAGAIAGSAVYISFVVGGVIALLSGYSLGKLGARYPSAGGIIEYLTQAFGSGTFTGTMGVTMYFAGVVSLSLIATAFGNYAVTLFPAAAPHFLNEALAVSILTLFVGVNLKGASDVAIIERLTVAIKFAVLCGLSVAGLVYMQPERLSPTHYPPVSDVLFSLAITFFAYEGFRVITNTAEDMPDPQTTLPRAMIAAVLLVMLLYVMVALAVFGNLPLADATAARDFALAEAARPIFGQLGFTVVAAAALVSTASSINANLYAVTNVTYQLAKDGELPEVFGQPIGHSREGLLISGFLAAVLSATLDLSEIAAIGSIGILLVHAVTHVGHLKIIRLTQASRVLVAVAALSCLAAAGMAMIYASRELPQVITLLAAFFAAAFITEVSLRVFTRRRMQTRAPD